MSIYTHNLIFSHPVMENRFRKTVNVNEEIGGWLLMCWDPKLLPAGLRRSQVVKGLPRKDRSNTWFVENFVIVPNESAEPTVEWSSPHFDHAKQLTEATAKAHGLHPLHFHTHPSMSKEPSPADFAFAADECEIYNHNAEFCIVTTYPLRLWPYRMSWGNVAQPHKNNECLHGRFWSWHMKELRNLRHRKNAVSDHA